VTDASIDDTASSSAYMDLRFHYQQPNGQFLASALNDASDIEALDFATAESFSDGLTRVFAHNQLLYLFGETTTEIWKTTGVGRPPLARQQVIERGLIGTLAATSIDNKIYFLDQERRVNVMSGAQYEPIEVVGLDDEIQGYTIVSDTIMMSYTLNRENFVEFIFPSENRSWTYHEKTGQVCKREDPSGDIFNSTAYVNVYGTTIALDKVSGKVYKLDNDTYQDDGSTINRTADTVIIDSNKIGSPNEKMSISRTYIRYDCSGSSVITVSAAKDGNLDSFAQSVSTTVSGSGILTLHRFPGGSCKECIIRVTTPSNTKVSILDVSVEATLQVDSND
jgi:hypothetical protein